MEMDLRWKLDLGVEVTGDVSKIMGSVYRESSNTAGNCGTASIRCRIYAAL